jgi:hypothetical protein
MISALIYLLIAGLVLYFIYWLFSLWISGVPLKIVMTILALIFLLYALHVFGFAFPALR